MIRSFNLINNDKGMALVLVLVFTTALLLLGGALITNALNEKLIAVYQIQEIKQQYLAEAGLEAGLAILMEDFFYNGELRGSLMDGEFIVQFENTGSTGRRIRSTGKLDDYQIEITLTVKLNEDGTLTVEEWKRL